MKKIAVFFLLFGVASCKKSDYFERPPRTGGYMLTANILSIVSRSNGEPDIEFFDFFTWPGSGGGFSCIPGYSGDPFKVEYIPDDSLILGVDSINWKLKYLYAHLNPKLLGKPLFTVRDVTLNQMYEEVSASIDNVSILFNFGLVTNDSLVIKSFLNSRLMKRDTTTTYYN